MASINATTFDTLEAAKQLRAAGFSEAQSEALTRVVRQVGQLDLSQLATKADFADLVTKADLRAALANFVTKADLQAALADAKADIFKWIVPLLLGQSALTAALVRLL